MDQSSTIPPERLMEAVDAIYAALEEMGRVTFDEPPSRLLGRPTQPSVFCHFTRHEIREAEQFLVRCGLMRRAAC